MRIRFVYFAAVMASLIAGSVWWASTRTHMSATAADLDRHWSTLQALYSERLSAAADVVREVCRERLRAERPDSCYELLNLRLRARDFGIPNRWTAKTSAHIALEERLGRALAKLFAEEPSKLRPLSAAAQDRLATIEHRIAIARRDYNQKAIAFNDAISSFPESLVASAHDIERRYVFLPTAADDSHVAVRF